MDIYTKVVQSMSEKNRFEFADSESFARQEVYEAFKRGVLQAPQVDIGGVLETASAAFEVAFDKPEAVSLITLHARLSPEQLADLKKVVAHAHAANGVLYAPKGYEHMFPNDTRTMMDEQLEDIWTSCADKALVLLENMIYAIRRLAVSAFEEERAEILLRGTSFREKSEFWLSYPGIRDMVEQCLMIIRESIRSPEFKQLASAWKTKIRENPSNSAYRSAESEMLNNPVIDLLEQKLATTGILDAAPLLHVSPRELVAQMLQPALM